MRGKIAVLSALAAMIGHAAADEVWRTQDGGLIVYETDIGSTAVWSAQAGDRTLSVYVPGLGGVWGGDRRRSYEGYYVGHAEGGPCEAALVAVDDRTSHDWGRARVVLAERGFPTTVLLLLSPCGGDEETLMLGEPAVDR